VKNLAQLSITWQPIAQPDSGSQSSDPRMFGQPSTLYREE